MTTRFGTDEELMLAFAKGDASAFEALVGRHRSHVFTFLLRSCGNRARAEDLLQETWLRVIRGSADYRVTKAKFTTWLFTLARNLVLDHARKRSSHDAPLDEVAMATLASDDASPEQAAHAAGLRPLLERALATLPSEQREVFLLREYAGMPFKDIAEVTGTSDNTVKSRMRYALDALRQRLVELGVEQPGFEEGKVGAG